MTPTALATLIAAACSFSSANIHIDDKIECSERIVNCAVTGPGDIRPEIVTKCVDKEMGRGN